MRIIIVGMIGLIFTGTAQAAVTAFLRPDPVAIVVQGPDSDAKRIFDNLDVPATDKPGFILEKVLESPSGQVAFTCRYATLSQATSCTVKVKRGANFEVSEEKNRAYLQSFKTEDAEFLFEHFVKNAEGKVPMFISERQDFAYSSDAERFILSYQQIGN